MRIILKLSEGAYEILHFDYVTQHIKIDEKELTF